MILCAILNEVTPIVVRVIAIPNHLLSTNRMRFSDSVWLNTDSRAHRADPYIGAQPVPRKTRCTLLRDFALQRQEKSRHIEY